jgi:hypothetical protein
MVFPVVGGNESKGYEISNSLRFNDGDSPELYKTLGSPTNNKIYTFSMWLKRSDVTATTTFIGHYDGSASNPFVTVQFRSDGALRVEAYDNSTTSVMSLRTSQLFRDPSAWYHIVLAFDTTQGTAANRVKVYVNGNQVTSFQSSYETYPDQDKVLAFNKENTEAYYGVYKYGNSGSGGNFYDGYITELHFIDGQQKAQTDFGEFDDNAVWIPKKYTGTYGNNGHFFEFKQTGTSANSSGIGADTSGNDNHFTPTNLAALDVTEDTCTNNFMTLNSISNYYQQSTFSEGNTKTVTASSPYAYDIGTIGLTKGKWYWEIKPTGSSGSDTVYVLGVSGQQVTANTQQLGSGAYEWAWYAIDGNIRHNGGSASGWSNVTYTTNDIIGIAMDLDNNKIYWSKNGTFQNSGDPTSGSTGTGAVALTDPASVPLGAYFIAVSYYDNSGQGTFECNFGNPAFSISSGNNDGKYGNFEYAPPSGYYAICTKRLAEFG